MARKTQISRKSNRQAVKDARTYKVVRQSWWRNYYDRVTQKSTPIVPGSTVIGRALVLVTAIMAFLACLALGTAWAVHRAAINWTGDAAKEFTLQIKPVDGLDIEDEVAKALRILGATPGILNATSLTGEESGKLLEPWLGPDLNLSDLPIPRLITLKIDRVSPPDLAALAAKLKAQIPGAVLDNHGIWREQVRAVAGWIQMASFLVLGLMLAATIAIIIFATRGAMSGNRDVVEVLHLVGARERFIAREFEYHFLLLGLKGGVIGGVAAAIAFIVARLAFERIAPQATGNEYGSLVSALSIGWAG
ncbi:MAG: hypothetical protein K8F25_04335, partial [Fimbriimonadaceae bacterium]|nr:hypothetical protein [Alphaproteobacteria bacterium]